MAGIAQPVAGSVSQGFHPLHQAVDISAPCGVPVAAVAPGIVRSVGDDGSVPYSLDFSANLEGGQGGNMVTVDHLWTPPYDPRARGTVGQRQVVAQYVHLSAVAVKVGQQVAAGTRLGAVGQTGTATGCHLHFGWRVGGVWTDYRDYLTGGSRGVGSYTMPAGGSPQTPPDYGSGPVQPPPKDPLGKPVGAYPLDQGRSCQTGYRPGTINPQLYGALPGLWFNRPTFADGTVLACVRNDLDAGDPANQTVQDALGDLAGTLGGIARNAGFLVAFLVLGLLGLWVLLRGQR